MKDYFRLYNECVAELEAIHIRPNYVRRMVVGEIPNGCLGICQHYTDDTNEIHLSPALEDARISDNLIKAVIIHELLHTLPNCMEHGEEGNWEWIADCVMNQYPQYNLRAHKKNEIYDLVQKKAEL